MTFGVFSPAGCSSKEDIPRSPSGGDKTPDVACPAGTVRLADASKKTLETCMASLPSDLTCPTGTVRLADASKKTLETCMPDTDTPGGGGQTPGGGGKAPIDTDNDGTPDFTDVDDDGDGLIEINSLVMLHNIRHNVNGDSYKTGAGAGDTTGCGKTGSVLCDGYELTQDLSFDKDGDGKTWTAPPSPDSNNVGYTLDPEDNASPYFMVADGGWKPIGEATIASNNAINCNNLCFNAIFEGNGHTITGLAISREERFIGMFGSTTTNAAIRNLGLIKNLANSTRTSDNNPIGGLVGFQDGGSITASYTTGDVNGGDGRDNVGGLVGFQNGGSIIASYARGDVYGGAGKDRVGGLVGSFRGNITASYARGAVVGGAENDQVGGLVGFQSNGDDSIIAYATGDVDGGAGDDLIGGLVGFASGEVGSSDSYGFGMAINGTINTTGTTYPTNVTSAIQLISTNVPSSWDDVTKNTKGAWNFGSSSETPALNYADYDGVGNKYYCTNAERPTAGTPIPIPCNTMFPNTVSPLIPGQERSP